jgi:hypothetical protein
VIVRSDAVAVGVERVAPVGVAIHIAFGDDVVEHEVMIVAQLLPLAYRGIRSHYVVS